jgi:hypothetical protein
MTASGWLLALTVAASAQSKVALEKKLASEYALTQPTADNFDIVTAGAVLVLNKGEIIMSPVSQRNIFQSTYKEGKINQSALAKSTRALDRFNHANGSAPQAPPATRTFVQGEKMWVTKIECKDDGVVFYLFTDAYSDVRYKAALKFAFSSKGSIPLADEMDRLVAEVFRIQDDGNGRGQQQTQAPAAAPAPAQAALPPIPPPPPPPAEEPQVAPKTLSLGQTTDQVVANFGQPDKIVKLGAKEIYVYKDFKVTFVSGKVTDVQ